MVFPFHLSPPAKSSTLPGSVVISLSTPAGYRGASHPATNTPFPTPSSMHRCQTSLPALATRPPRLTFLRKMDNEKQTLWAGAARTDILGRWQPPCEGDRSAARMKLRGTEEGHRPHGPNAPPRSHASWGQCPSQLKAW